MAGHLASEPWQGEKCFAVTAADMGTWGTMSAALLTLVVLPMTCCWSRRLLEPIHGIEPSALSSVRT